MANTNVFPLEDTLVVDGVTYGEARGSKFVDFAGLDYFWSKAKSYVDAADADLASRATALEATVNGTANAEGVLENGLVQKVDKLRADVDALGGEEGGIQGMIDASIEALDLDNKFSTADTNAQGYASDAAAGALSDAKAYVDGIVNDTTAEDGSTVKGLNSKISDLDAKIDDAADALDAHVNATYDLADGSKASIHLAAGEREAWNQAKADIDAFLSDNDLTQDVVDTLTEIQNYITSDLAAADEMVKRVGALEDKVGAPASDDAEATGLYKIISDNEKVTSEALTDLDSRVDALEAQDVYVKTDVDAAIAAAAKAGTDAAATAEGNAKTYTDELFASVTFISKADIDGMFA